MDLRVLTWNLCHGRVAPGAGHDRYAAFAAALAGWPWDVALLQEMPPWWLAPLRESLHCEACGVLTSAAGLVGLRRALAVHAPVLMRSAGGGANAILARSDRIIRARTAALGGRSERRRVQGVALACGVWVSNLQAGAGGPAERHLRAAVGASWEWARAERLPLILGGDLGLPTVSAEGLRTAASRGVHHVLCGAGIEIRAASAADLEGGALSAHAPLAVTVVI